MSTLGVVCLMTLRVRGFVLGVVVDCGGVICLVLVVCAFGFWVVCVSFTGAGLSCM